MLRLDLYVIPMVDYQPLTDRKLLKFTHREMYRNIDSKQKEIHGSEYSMCSLQIL